MIQAVKSAFSMYWLLQKYSLRLFLNGLFYYLTRIPFIGKFVPLSMLVGDYRLKDVLFYFLLAGKIVLKIMFKFLWLFLCYFAAGKASFFSGERGIVSFIIWVLCVVFTGNFNEGLYYSIDTKQYHFMSNFHVTGHFFSRDYHLLESASDLVAYVPAFLVFIFFFNWPVWSLPLAAVLYLGMVSWGLYVNRKCYEVRWSFLLKGSSSIGMLLAAVGLGYLLLVAKETTSIMVLAGLIAAFLLSGVGAYLLFAYAHEEEFVRKLKHASTKAAATVEKAKTQKYFSDGLSMHKKMTISENTYDHLRGSGYLNALLFSRYRKTLVKGAGIRVGTVLIVGLIILIVSLFIPFDADFEESLTNLLPSMFFFLYLISLGKKIVQTLFISCDSSMLSYPFYREKEAILKGFFYRFYKILLYNGLTTLTVLLMVLLINAVNQFILSWQFIGTFTLLIISLTILFSFHELFVYYMLQPFTSKLEVANPIYKIVDGLFYLFAYLNMQINTASLTYALIISGVALCYFIVGILIIRRFAPKTFVYKG